MRICSLELYYITDPKKLEHIQQNFETLCFNRFFAQYDYSYALPLERLKLHSLLVLAQIYRGSKFCPSVLYIIDLLVPSRHIRDLSVFKLCSCSKNCPSARYTSAANVVCRDVDVFGTKTLSLQHVL
jgi:hypothetical protein